MTWLCKILAANLALIPVLQWTTTSASECFWINSRTSSILVLNWGSGMCKAFSNTPVYSTSGLFLTSMKIDFFFGSSYSSFLMLGTISSPFHSFKVKLLNPKIFKYPILRSLSMIYFSFPWSVMSKNGL